MTLRFKTSIIESREGAQLFRELLDANTPYSIEPGVSIQSSVEILRLCAEYPDRIFPAVGIHPTRSIDENWSERKQEGVIHCFYGSREIAEQYLKPGYHIPEGCFRPVPG